MKDLSLCGSTTCMRESLEVSRGDSVVRMWVQFKRWCVSCVWVLRRGYSGDECDLPLTLYDLRSGYLFVLSWARVRRVRMGKSLFNAANVWWRCVQYFVIASCG